MRDSYQILSITKAASTAEIKRAFRAKAKLYHPDLHPNDTAVAREFHEIVRAYQACLQMRQEKDQAIKKERSFSDELRRANSDASSPPYRQRSSRKDPKDRAGLRKQHGGTPRTTPPRPRESGGLAKLIRDTLFGGFEKLARQSPQRSSPTMTSQRQSQEKKTRED